MQYELISIKRKALRVNLEESIYGTFAEIGAGQEVARTFFQVGGASGTVAKTMSAYDMAFSDNIYGEEESGRYVSESRLSKMLSREFELLQERLTDEKYQNRRFFAFADTCTTINYAKTNDPHCWMGVRFQLYPGGPCNEIILHIRLKEDDALAQQRTIGAIGVNLLFAAFWYHGNLDVLLQSLMDNVTRDQAEIDMCRISGKDFEHVDNRLVALMLVKKEFTSATIFGPDKQVCQPKDLLYKKHVLCLRGRFRPVTKVNLDMLDCGIEYCKKHKKCDLSEMEVITELNLNSLETESERGLQDFLDRADILCNLGYDVLVSNCHKHDKLVEYLERCKPQSIELILGIMNIIELFNESYYDNASRELLTYFGTIFKSRTQMLVYPYQPLATGPIITTENIKIPDSLLGLFNYLKDSGFLIDLSGYNKDVLQIFSPNVIDMIRSGKDGWEIMVPAKVADMIKENCLFEYPCKVKV